MSLSLGMSRNSDLVKCDLALAMIKNTYHSLQQTHVGSRFCWARKYHSSDANKLGFRRLNVRSYRMSEGTIATKCAKNPHNLNCMEVSNR